MNSRRNRSRSSGFESINITPFTDVLLVLVIIFLIAGSSFTPSGLSTNQLATGTDRGKSVEREMAVNLVVAENGAIFRQGLNDIRKPVDLNELDPEQEIFLTTSEKTRAETLIQAYDRVLSSGFTKVYLTEPTS